MKTPSMHLLPAAAVLLLASIYAGCADNTPGPLTRAVTLSDLKTFNVVAALPKDTTTEPAGSTRTKPPVEVLAQAVRQELESRGYQYQATSPDFLISADWIWFDKMVQTDLPGPGVTKTELVSLEIVVKNAATNEVLWHNPTAAPVSAPDLPDATARDLVRDAMKDFPPAQSAVK